VIIWASYAAVLGYVFGKSFEDNHTAAFILAFGAALSITVLIEVVRHANDKRKGKHGDESGEATPDEVRADS
jgi:hypothetical protein